MSAKKHPKNQHRVRVVGVRRSAIDVKKVARALLETAKAMTPEEIAELEAETKERNYRAAIKEVVERMSNRNRLQG